MGLSILGDVLTRLRSALSTLVGFDARDRQGFCIGLNEAVGGVGGSIISSPFLYCNDINRIKLCITESIERSRLYDRAGGIDQ